ncbi:SDR family NAD(P)-dependent oxidoreductase [Luteipulveratus halotolerans]|uniref:3-oxoacyl-ACP reductase n=1 Tax=Luteipulveratus halotolerans TaxID=1631356 RepID=A0A0L6CMA9_9MICO|nr:SDR family NAD(P)-dependent oxidoreductase [Luteipulveratus halotolerans]KNX38877.1 hypothetical protein VV01_19840 [Luteipulveratus halotolerans]
MKKTVVTGSTSGLGTALVRDLAVRGHRLLLHGRDEARLATVATEAGRHGAQVTTFAADLTDPAAVDDLCRRALDATDTLDLVINNAAVGGGADPSRRETNAYGTELRMAANVVAPHLIARRLAPALAPGGRIVQVGSMGQSALDVADLGFEQGYDGVEAYCRSKLALVMDTIDLAATGVWANVVHPAHLMPTTMVRDSGFTPAATIDDGALPVLRAALDTELADVTGRYFHRFDEREAHQQAYDPAVRLALQTWVGEQLAAADVRLPAG